MKRKRDLITLGGHGDDGFGRGVILVLYPWIVLVQELRKWRCLRQQLADHVSADVGSLFESEYAQDLGLDAVEPHLLAVLPEVAGRALLPTLCQHPGSLVHLHGKPCRDDGQHDKDKHNGEKTFGAVTLCINAVWVRPQGSGIYECLI